MLGSREARTRKLRGRCRLVGHCFTGRLMLSAEKPLPGSVDEVEGRINGSDTFSTDDGGEWVGVTLTLAEKVGSKFFDKIKASKRLKHSNHLRSKSAILVSALV